MEVPTISLASYFDVISKGNDDIDALVAGSEKLAGLIDEIRTACEEVGFFIVVDHGVDEALLRSQKEDCASFFTRPPQSLIMSMVQGSQSRFHWLDYVPPDPDAGPNATEAWSIGPIEGRGSMAWRLDSKKMEATWMAYYSAMERLVAVLMKLVALALCLPSSAFDNALVGHRSSLRAIFYPMVSESELDESGGSVIRCGEHSDWGCISVLMADETVGGLEVLRKDDSWAVVPPVPGGLVVNLGDLLPCWTGGRCVATPHRVVARPESRHERLSIPYFGLVNRNTKIEPFTNLESNCKGEAGHVTITAGEFFDNHEQYVRSKRGDLS